jgi:flagellar capping protein FliD
MSIITTLGSGSGIDVAKLVGDLAAASRGPKVARLTARTQTVQTNISRLALLRSDLSTLVNSVGDAVAAGTLKSRVTGDPPVRDWAAMTTALRDLATGLNALRMQLAEVRAGVRGEMGLRGFERAFGDLISTPLVSAGPPSRLSDIGFATQRDGSVTFDAALFTRVARDAPEGVDALFNPPRDATRTPATDPGFAEVLRRIEADSVGTMGTLGALIGRLQREVQTLDKAMEAVEAREARYRERLERQFQGLDGRVGALKATQDYLKQQVEMWTAAR